MATQVSYWPPRDGGSGGAAWGDITGTLSAQTDLNTALNSRVPKTTTVNAKELSTDIVLDKTDIGLANVDNTSDADKPVSADQQTALNAKQDTLVSGTNIKTVNSTSLLGSGDIEISAGGATVNVETLTANKNLVGTDDDYQILSGDANYNVYLPQTGVSDGKTFTFVNNNTYDSTFYIRIYNNVTIVQQLYAQAMCSFVFDGTAWISGINASNQNTAVGYGADGNSYGAAVGYDADGNSYGAAVGYGADGRSYGAAVGYGASGYTYGAAVGCYTNTNSKGKNTVAIGYYSKVERAKEFTFTHTENAFNKSSTCIIGIKEISNVVNGTFAEQFLDASSARLTLLTDSLLNFTLKYNAIDSTAAEAKTWEITGSIKNDGGVVALVGTPTKTVLGATSGATTWDIQVSADDTNNSLKLEFKGDATTIRRGGSFYLTDVRV